MSEHVNVHECACALLLLITIFAFERRLKSMNILLDTLELVVGAIFF
jgi:hypothetical protein